MMKELLMKGDKLMSEINEKTEQKSDKLQWMKEARFAMFIHWGAYALPAGEWEGKYVESSGEWIMYGAKIPVKDYEKMTRQFNPVKFNADEWARLARDAGMKYMVITAKHCDGFAMYHSKASSYNIYDMTPFKRDPLKELEEACDKYGIKLGFYYSHNWD
jgi:alpha-L-fucosidase